MMWFIWSLVVALRGAQALAADYASPAIRDTQQFEAWSLPGGGLIKTGRTMRFVICVAQNNPRCPAIAYANANYTENGVVPDFVRYHYDFSQRVFSAPEALEEFNLNTYFSPRKRYFAGVIHSYPLAGRAVFAMQFYPQDIIRETEIVEAAAWVKRTMPDVPMIFLSTGSQQTSETVSSHLATMGLPVWTVERLREATNHVSMEEGEAVGYLRLSPSSPGEEDIVIYDRVPNELPPVAASFVRTTQDLLAPWNRKAKEHGIPNLTLRDAGPRHPRLAPFIGKPVRVIFRGDDFEIRGVDESEILRVREARQNRPLKELAWGDETALIPPARVPSASLSYGEAASTLGALTRAPQASIANAIAVPASVYKALVDANPTLGKALETKVGVEQAFREATWPAALSASLEQAVGPLARLTVRSSNHVDDISDPIRETAGSGELLRAIQRVYSRSWRAQAVAERRRKRIDLSTVRIPLLIVEEPRGERVEIITRVVNVKDVYGYQWVAGGETGVAAFGRDWEPISFTLVRSIPGSPHISQQLVRHAKGLEIAYCVAREGSYYPLEGCSAVPADNRKPRSLILEIASHRGSFTLVDAREFRGK